MNMHNETWGNQDNDQNDLDNSNSLPVNNGDDYDGELESDNDDELDEEFEEDDTTDLDETPEEGETDNEGAGYHSQPEVEQQQRGADTSYSEQTDVTPPNKHEFPSTGPAKTDFESRPQGRTTGRMVGHEPGTEGI